MIPYNYIQSSMGTIGAMSVMIVAGASGMASAEDIKVVTNGGYKISDGTDEITKNVYGFSSYAGAEKTGPGSSNLPMAKTLLGEKLLAYRRQVLAKGATLLTIDEINEIVKEARGNG